MPKNSRFMSSPEGYVNTFKIRPQGKDLMTDEEVEEAQEQGQAFVIGNLLLRSIFA